MTEERQVISIKGIKIGLMPIIVAIVILAISIFVLIIILLLSESSPKKKKYLYNLSPKIVEIEDIDSVLTGALLRLEAFDVNLKGTVEDSLHLDLTLEFFQFDLPKDIDVILPKIRHAIIGVISLKSEYELLGSSNLESLRKELIEVINNNLDENNQVVNVYFNSFVIK